MQPENPAQLGGKIYEMMGMALSGKWTSSDAWNQAPHAAAAPNTQTFEAEVVEPEPEPEPEPVAEFNRDTGSGQR